MSEFDTEDSSVSEFSSLNDETLELVFYQSDNNVYHFYHLIRFEINKAVHQIYEFRGFEDKTQRNRMTVEYFLSQIQPTQISYGFIGTKYDGYQYCYP